MSGRRHLRLVAVGDDVDDPPPPVPTRQRRRDARLFARLVDEFEGRGWHPLVAAIEADAAVQRQHRADERKGRP